MTDYEKEYEDFWQDIVETKPGELNPDLVKKELSDYRRLMDNASRVFYELTGGRISKPNAHATDVIREADAFVERQIDDATKELREQNEKLELVAEKAEKLCDKLDEIFHDPGYISIFSLAQGHGIVYDGPNCTDELSDLKTALEELNPEQQ